MHCLRVKTMRTLIIILIIILMIAGCDQAESEKTTTSISSAQTVTKPTKQNIEQSSVVVSYQDEKHHLMVHGRCQADPHYNFWAIKPEFINTTGQGPRLHLIGGPEQTVVKYYQDDKQLLSKVLSGKDAVPYDGQRMNIRFQGDVDMVIKVDCQK